MEPPGDQWQSCPQRISSFRNRFTHQHTTVVQCPPPPPLFFLRWAPSRGSSFTVGGGFQLPTPHGPKRGCQPSFSRGRLKGTPRGACVMQQNCWAQLSGIARAVAEAVAGSWTRGGRQFLVCTRDEYLLGRSFRGSEPCCLICALCRGGYVGMFGKPLKRAFGGCIIRGGVRSHIFSKIGCYR